MIPSKTNFTFPPNNCLNFSFRRRWMNQIKYQFIFGPFKGNSCHMSDKFCNTTRTHLFEKMRSAEEDGRFHSYKYCCKVNYAQTYKIPLIRRLLLSQLKVKTLSSTDISYFLRLSAVKPQSRLVPRPLRVSSADAPKGN